MAINLFISTNLIKPYALRLLLFVKREWQGPDISSFVQKKKKKDYIKNNVFQETMYQVVRNDPQLGDPTVSWVGCLESYKAETWEGKSMWKPHDFLNQDVAERLGRT